MITKPLSSAVAVAAFTLATAAILKYANGLAIIDAETARRTMQVTIGLILAVSSNSIPKAIARSQMSARAVTRSQSALRVAGWSLTLAGLGYATLWAFAPISFAGVAAKIILAAATLVTVGYGGWTLVNCRWIDKSPSIEV